MGAVGWRASNTSASVNATKSHNEIIERVLVVGMQRWQVSDSIMRATFPISAYVEVIHDTFA